MTTSSTENVHSQNDPETIVETLAIDGRHAAKVLATASSETKADALRHAAKALRDHSADICAANDRDMAAGKERGLTDALLDRLMLDADRVAAIASAVEAVAELPDPVGDVISTSSQPNGLKFARVRIPIGLIGIITKAVPT